MKTKLILSMAAVGALSLASASADVTSVNVVGFVNVNLKTGFNLLSNPLASTNGTETVATVLPSLPNGSFISRWNSAAQSWGSPYQFNTDDNGPVGWDDPNQVIKAGEAFFLQVPNNVTITFVGEVRQNPAYTMTTPLVLGFNFVGSQVPQAGNISSLLGYAANNNELLYQFNSGGGWKSPLGYNTDDNGPVGWDTAPAEPQLGIAEGVAVTRVIAGNWTRAFQVQ